MGCEVGLGRAFNGRIGAVAGNLEGQHGGKVVVYHQLAFLFDHQPEQAENATRTTRIGVKLGAVGAAIGIRHLPNPVVAAGEAVSGLCYRYDAPVFDPVDDLRCFLDEPVNGNPDS